MAVGVVETLKMSLLDDLGIAKTFKPVSVQFAPAAKKNSESAPAEGEIYF